MELFGPLGPPGPRNRGPAPGTNFSQFSPKNHHFHGNVPFLHKIPFLEHPAVPLAPDLCFTNAFSMILGGTFGDFLDFYVKIMVSM